MPCPLSASGIYFIRINTGTGILSKKITLLR
ncbi:MAG: T9SS type A sorting domain-containing protein [Fibrobacterota bacterium]